MSETDLSRRWDSEVFDPSTGHPMPISVEEFPLSKGSGSVVELRDPVLGTVDDPMGLKTEPVTILIEGKPLADRTSSERTDFYNRIRAAAAATRVLKA